MILDVLVLVRIGLIGVTALVGLAFLLDMLL